MGILTGILQAVILFVAVAVALWFFLRRIVTDAVIEQLQVIECDLVLREFPPVNPGTGVDPIAAFSAALVAGTERIDDVRLGGRAGCRATGQGASVRMVVTSAVELRTRVPVSIGLVPGASNCNLVGVTALLVVNTARVTFGAGALPLENAVITLQGIDGSTVYSLKPLTGSDHTIVPLYSRLSIDALAPATNFARGTFELMLRTYADPNDRTVLFVTNGRFGLRRQ